MDSNSVLDFDSEPDNIDLAADLAQISSIDVPQTLEITKPGPRMLTSAQSDFIDDGEQEEENSGNFIVGMPDEDDFEDILEEEDDIPLPDSVDPLRLLQEIDHHGTFVSDLNITNYCEHLATAIRLNVKLTGIVPKKDKDVKNHTVLCLDAVPSLLSLTKVAKPVIDEDKAVNIEVLEEQVADIFAKTIDPVIHGDVLDFDADDDEIQEIEEVQEIDQVEEPPVQTQDVTSQLAEHLLLYTSKTRNIKSRTSGHLSSANATNATSAAFDNKKHKHF